MNHFYKNVNRYFHFYKYEILVLALLQHLFIGIFIQDLEFYIHYVWPLNMLILGIASSGVYIEKDQWKKNIKNIFLVIVIGFPISLWFHFDISSAFMIWLNIAYFLFFLFILIEVLKFLLTPNYINLDLIIASICGYLLIIELATFAFQYYFYRYPNCFIGVHNENPVDTYASFVYFSTVTITSIGFGDISPSIHFTKLLTSFFGILGQLYSVLLIGILISKFNTKNN
ncbi:MAG: potassium channel family protein [Chitinophagales bacterium]|jgi:hypothetical protein|nr:potassium channel family protein [Sphingobacteriales bacterium]